MEEFKTLQVPHVRVLDIPVFLSPNELEGLPLQILALPWVSRSGLMASLEISASSDAHSFDKLEDLLAQLAAHRLERSSFIVALGGGVTGDLAGFVAATYLRGIAFVQVRNALRRGARAGLVALGGRRRAAQYGFKGGVDKLFTRQFGGEAAGLDGAAFAERDDLFGHGARGLGLGERGGDAFVFDEAANQVGEHRVAVFAGSAQLGSSLKVSHKQ